MKKRSKKKTWVAVIVIIIISIGPVAILKGTIDTNIQIDNAGGSPQQKHFKTQTFKAGIFYGLRLKPEFKELDLISVESNTFNIGIYSSTYKRYEFEYSIDNHLIRLKVDAKAKLWGIGSIFIRSKMLHENIEQQLNKELKSIHL